MPNDEKTEILQDAEVIEEQLKIFDEMAKSYTEVDSTGLMEQTEQKADPAMEKVIRLAGYREFREKMAEISRKTSEFYQIEADGHFHKAEGQDIADLIAMYREAYKQLNLLMNGIHVLKEQNAEEFGKSPFVETFSGILEFTGGLLEKDTRMLTSLNSAEPVDLPHAIIGNRAVKVTVTDDYVNTVGNVLSSRIPMNFTDADGKVHKGFFTEDKRIEYTQAMKDAVEEAKSKTFNDPRKRPVPENVQRIFTNFCENVLAIPELRDNPGKLFSEAFDCGMVECTDKHGKRLHTRASKMEQHLADNFKFFSDHYNKEGLPHPWNWREGMSKREQQEIDEYLKNPVPFPNLHFLCFSFFANVSNKSQAFGQCFSDTGYIQINQMNNTSVAQRNCAMSAVANLLGVSRLVAHSSNMKVTVGGVEKTGVFMENGVGEDLRLVSKDSPLGQARQAYNGKQQQQILAGSAKKDIYALQILDYICNNVDRHLKNMLYAVDPVTHKITGVQGIDNDLSFGTEVPAPDKTVPLGSAVPLNDLLFVPNDLADTILALDPALLDVTLKGFELSEMERQAATARLEQVQKGIRDGVIKRVSDQELEALNLNVKKREVQKDGKEHYSQTVAFAGFSNSIQSVINTNERIQREGTFEERRKLSPIMYNNTTTEPLAGMEEDDYDRQLIETRNDASYFNGVLDSMKASDKMVWFGGNIFSELETLADETAKASKTAARALEQGSVRVAKLYTEEYRAQLEALKAKAEQYLKTKDGVDESSMDDGEKMRLHAAQDLQNRAERRLRGISKVAKPDPTYALRYERLAENHAAVEQHMMQNGINARAYAAWKLTGQLQAMGEETFRSIGYDGRQLERDIARFEKSPAMQFVDQYLKTVQMPKDDPARMAAFLKQVDEAYEYVKGNMPFYEKCKDQTLNLKTAARYRSAMLTIAHGTRKEDVVTAAHFTAGVKTKFARECYSRIGKYCTALREWRNQNGAGEPQLTAKEKRAVDPLMAGL